MIAGVMSRLGRRRICFTAPIKAVLLMTCIGAVLGSKKHSLKDPTPDAISLDLSPGMTKDVPLYAETSWFDNRLELYTVSAEDLRAGEAVLSNPMGVLCVELTTMMRNVTTYVSQSVNKAGTHHRKNSSTRDMRDAQVPAGPLFPVLRRLEEPFWYELWKVAKTTLNMSDERFANHCPDLREYPHLVVPCVRFATCLIESYGDGLPLSIFAVVAEFEHVMAEDIIPNLQRKLGAFEDVGHAEGCEAENGMALLQDSAIMSSARYHSAVAMASKISHSAGQMQQVLSRMASNASEQSVINRLQEVWVPTCKELGCDHMSWLDIMGHLHGHAAELIDSGVQPSITRKYIHDVRRSHLRLVNTSPLLLQSLAESFMRQDATGRGMEQHVRYHHHAKRAGGILDGAVQRHFKSDIALTRLKMCFGFSLSTTVGYTCNMISGTTYPPPPGSSGLGISFSIAFTRGWGQIGLEKMLEGKFSELNPYGSAGAKLAIKLGILIGWLAAGPVGAAVGTSFSGSISIPTNPMTWLLKLSASVSGGGSAAFKECPFYRFIGEKFDKMGIKCRKGWGIGFTTVCCEINLATGDNDCADGLMEVFAALADGAKSFWNAVLAIFDSILKFGNTIRPYDFFGDWGMRFSLVNVKHSQCLTKHKFSDGRRRQEKARLQNCIGGEHQSSRAQQFELQEHESRDGRFLIINADGSRCLAYKDDISFVPVMTCDYGNPEMLWIASAAKGADAGFLKNAGTSQTYGFMQASGTWSDATNGYFPSDAQASTALWRMIFRSGTRPITHSWGQFVSVYNHECLDVRDWSTADRAALVTRPCHGGANQQFGVTEIGLSDNQKRTDSTGNFFIYAKHGKKVIDQGTGSLHMYYRHGNDWQVWKFHLQSDDSWLIKNLGRSSIMTAPEEPYGLVYGQGETWNQQGSQYYRQRWWFRPPATDYAGYE